MAANRRFPVLLATRVTRRERAMVDALAQSEGMTVTALLRGILLPAVGERIARAARQTLGTVA